MKIVCFLLKLVLKILLLPVVFLLRFLCFIWNLLMQLSLWVLSPVMLFVLGCGIYSVVRASWTDVFLLTLIDTEDGTVRSCGWSGRHHGTDGTAVRVCRGCFDNLSSGGIRWIFSL